MNQTRKEALQRIREAWKRCRANHDAAAGLFVSFQEVGASLEQIHHGTTDFALAAWAELRTRFLEQVHAVYGVVDYLVPDMDGARTIREPALVIERLDGLKLFLTGCSWGYGGEGPHGTAVILCDLGLAEDMNAAGSFVRSVAGMMEPWEISGHAIIATAEVAEPVPQIVEGQQ